LAVIVINHLDYPVRYAGWFGKKHAKAAIESAAKAEFYVLPVETPEIEDLASRLPEGVVEAGALRLSQIEEGPARELEALLLARQAETAAQAEAATSEAGEHGAQPTLADDDSRTLRDLWSMLKPGLFVLAADLDRQGVPEAWYEAEIVSLEGPEITLRWRDFPRDGLLSRTRRHIAILHPAD